MLVKCPSCGGSRKVADSLRGRKGRCKGCQQVFVLNDATHPTGLDASQATLQGLPPSAASRPTPTGMPRQVGRFQIRARVGSGAFGTVYRAFDPEMDREVALKVPLPGTLNSPRAVARFFREARAAAQLSHPHIVPLFDAGHDGSHHYIASAFIDGRTLADALRENAVDSYQDAARIVEQLAQALAHAHEQGIVHRDVKSSNVMLDGAGDAHLMDFGLAHRQQDSTRLTNDGAVMGTPAYMAPEQAGGAIGNPLAASDQYSLGVVLYELLTGEVPFRGRNETVLYHVLHSDPARPRSVRPDIPRDLETICLKAMAREPEQRYADCQQLADDLRRWLEDEPIVARRLAAHERLLRWWRRHPALAWSLAGVAGCILVLAGILTASSLLVAHQAQQEQSAAQTAERAQQTENRERHRAEQEQQRAQQLSAQAKQQEQEMKRAKQAAQKSKHRAREARLATQAERQKTEKTLREIEAAEGSVQEILASIRFQQQQAELARREIRQRQQRDADARFDSLKQRLERLFKSQSGVGIPHGVACTPDGKRLASAGPEHTVWIWDTATRKRLHLLRGHFNAVTQVLFAAEGKELISASWDQTVVVWDLSRNAPRLTFREHQGPVWCLALSPDGRTVASAGLDTTIHLWDVRTGQPTGQFHTKEEGIMALAFSRDGHYLASGGTNGMALIWNLQTRKPLPLSLNHQSWVRSLNYGDPSNRLITASSKGVIRLWDISSAKVYWQVRVHPQPITSIWVKRMGYRHGFKQWDLVSVTPHQGLEFWDLIRKKSVVRCRYSRDSLISVAFPRFDGPGYGGTGRFDRWGRAIPTGVQFTNGIHVTLQEDTGYVSGVSFSPDGKRIVTGGPDKMAKVWDAGTGKEQLTLKGHTSVVRGVCFSSDGKRIVSASDDQTVRVWEAATGNELLTLKGHSNYVNSVCFSPDGKRIVSGGQDRNVKVWDASTGKEVHTLGGHVEAVSSVAFSPDSKRIVNGSFDKTVKVWDAARGKEMLTLKGHTDAVYSVAFGPDGKRVVTGSGDDTLKVWDPNTGQVVLTLKGSSTNVSAVAFSPDGKRIVSGRDDGAVNVWDATTGKEILTFKGHRSSISSVAFSPDGKRILSGGSSEVKIWDAVPSTQGFHFR